MFFGMMRVKNEERWIERVLNPLLEICETVHVLDDGSTDNTAKIVKGMDRCIYHRSHYATLDESRDKTFLMNMLIVETFPESEWKNVLQQNSPHWVVCIDGDEEICEADLHKFNQPLQGVSYSFQILTLYDSSNQIRVDPPYNKMLRPSMFRLIKPGMVFKSNAKHGGGFHCSNVPADIGFAVRTHQPEPVRVKHYGYIEKETRERKYKFYMEHDPGYRGLYQQECYGKPVLAPLPEGL